MIQLTLRILPVTVISSCICRGVVGMGAARVLDGGVRCTDSRSLPLIIGTAAALVLFCLIITYVSARSIRKISVTELVTE